MKKILFRSLAACLLLFGVAACAEPDPLPDPDIPDNPSDNPGGGDLDDNDDKDDPDEPEIDEFEIITENNGLSIEKETFEFTNAKEGDTYLSPYEITAYTDNTWSWVTGLREEDTKIVSQNQSVIPDSALSISIIDNSDLVGSSGSNEIEQIKIEIDRKLINPGSTKIKLNVHPLNGSSSVTKLTTLCFNAVVHEYGTIAIETYNLDFALDLSGLDEIIADVNKPESATFTISDMDGETFYGYNYDSLYQVDIPLDNIPEEITFSEFKFAKDHQYYVQIFIEAEDYKDRNWIKIKEKRSSSDYKFEDENLNSILTLSDDATVEAELGDVITYNDIV